MKSFRTRMILLLALVLSFVFIVSNVVLYHFVRGKSVQQITKEQSYIASTNQTSMEYFLQSIDYSFQFLISDRMVGEILSQSITSDLALHKAKTDLKSQFFHCSVTLTTVDGYAHKSYLFLNDKIPLAQYHEKATLDHHRERISNVYTNSSVKYTDWYHDTMDRNRALYIFLEPATQQLCFARKIQSLYYTGPYQKEGIGVMVVEMDRNRLEHLFRFTEITPNTQVMLFNDKQDPLYQSSEENTFLLSDVLGNRSPQRDIDGEIITIDGQRYVVNLRQLSWDMKLLFLTPYSDLSPYLNQFVRFFAILLIVTLGVLLLAIYGISAEISRPILSLSDTMRQMKDTRTFDFQSTSYQKSDEIGELYNSFLSMVSQINALLDDVTIQTEKQKQAELKALQAQINPHFLYNAMDSVNWIAMTNEQDAIAEMVSSIASIMRYAITNPDDVVTVQDELENIEQYLSLQQIRYNGRLYFHNQLPEQAFQWSIPKLMLQPLVENSILHGISDSHSNLHIVLDGKISDNTLIITLTDDGVGADSEQLNRYLIGEESPQFLSKVKGGFGIRNIHRRLQLKLGENARLYYRNLSDGRLEAVLIIPSLPEERKD